MQEVLGFLRRERCGEVLGVLACVELIWLEISELNVILDTEIHRREASCLHYSEEP